MTVISMKLKNGNVQFGGRRAERVGCALSPSDSLLRVKAGSDDWTLRLAEVDFSEMTLQQKLPKEESKSGDKIHGIIVMKQIGERPSVPYPTLVRGTGVSLCVPTWRSKSNSASHHVGTPGLRLGTLLSTFFTSSFYTWMETRRAEMFCNLPKGTLLVSWGAWILVLFSKAHSWLLLSYWKHEIWNATHLCALQKCSIHPTLLG